MNTAANLAVAIVLLAAACLWGCGNEGDESDPNRLGSGSSQQVRTPKTLARIDLNGLRALIREADEKNNVLVIDFWATWCAPCVELFPQLHKAVSELGTGVELMSVSLDAPGEGESQAMRFLDEHGGLANAYLLQPDSELRAQVVRELGRQWEDLVVPAVLIYSSDGQLIEELIGADALVDDVIHVVQGLRQQKSSGP